MVKNRRIAYIYKMCCYCLLVVVLSSILPYNLNDENTKTVRILFIRHGRTLANNEGRLIGGGSDSALLNTSKKEAQALGVELRNTKVDRLYTSELGRTQETLLYICNGAEWKEEYCILPELNDISWGDAEGYTIQEFLNRFEYSEMPDAFGDIHDMTYISPINAETKYSFCNRFMKGVKRIIERSQDGETIVCITHNSLRFWVEYVFDCKVSMDNLDIIELVYEDNEARLYFKKENEVRCVSYRGDILENEE